MKKAGILTTYFATNFGAMLQPFALKRTLEYKGLDVEVIRYKQPRVYQVYKPIKISRNIKATIRNLMSLPILLKKASVYRKYMYKHINPLPGFCDKIPSDKDFYFMGSDQIWNPVITDGFDDVYFGKFPVKKESKKIAYAASAESIDYTPEQVAYLKENLANFDHIGVREQTLADNLIKHTGISDISVVVDPTLVANPKIYDEIEQINPMKGKKFVLFYKIRDCINFAPKILEYARSVNAELLILSSWYERDIVKFSRSHKDVTYLPAAGVEIFLGAIKNAECVFTPSFHGCVFPILFHTPFYCLVLNDTWNTRAHDLLCTLSLTDRFLRIDDVVTSSPIDFNKVDVKVEEVRRVSNEYIDYSILE